VSATPLAVVVSGFPRRSETFAVNELAALERAGMLAALFATRPGDGAPPSPEAARLLERLSRLPDADEATQAEVLEQRLAGRRVRGIHAYFAHRPAGVARRAAERLGLPFGFSTHARDARKIDAAERARRARAARCVIACNDDVASEFGDAGCLRLVPHGVDTDRFRSALEPEAGGEVVAVGRLVPKKGFEVLIEAFAALPHTPRLRIVGEGPERKRLEARVRALGLGRRVRLPGACAHEVLPAILGRARIVAVPSVVDASGDRDGLPNVVLEALACARPVVASAVAAIPAAVADGTTGLLVPPGDPGALARALLLLWRDPARAGRLGREGRTFVASRYGLERCRARFVQTLEAAYGA
jgi:glycosyltransferase involved in cell wall biosynthesis